MTFHQNLFGVFAAAVTPLHSDYSLALDELPPFLDFLARRGCHGALLFGTTGEGPSFSLSERRELLQVAIEIRQVKPDFRLLAGTGTPSLDETIEITQTAFELDFDGVIVLPPYYYKNITDDGLFDWYARVIQSSVPAGGAFLAYHIPHVTGIPLSLELLARLKDAFPDRFAGEKDTSADPEYARKLGERFGKDLLVFSGTDSLLSIALDSFACGCITAMANLRSADARLIWDAYERDARKQGSFRRSQKILDAQTRLDKARAIMDRYPPNPALYKALVARLHRFPRWMVRPPLLPMPDDKLEKALSEAIAEVEDFDL
jgi:4-hydroxy-tetrahydrodipicolinate synthase